MRKVLRKLIPALIGILTPMVSIAALSYKVTGDGSEGSPYTIGTGENVEMGQCVYTGGKVTWKIGFGDAGVSGLTTDGTTTRSKSGSVKTDRTTASLRKITEALDYIGATGTVRTLIKTTGIPEEGDQGAFDPVYVPGKEGKWVTDIAWVATDDTTAVIDTVPEESGTCEGADCVPGGGGTAKRIIAYQKNGDILVKVGSRTTVIHPAGCTDDDCLAERSSQIDQLIREAEERLTVEEVSDTPEGKWVNTTKWVEGPGGHWEVPEGYFVSSVPSVDWGVKYGNIDIDFTLDLSDGATSEGSGYEGADMEYTEGTGTATVTYRKVHDYTVYIWNITGPNGSFTEYPHKRSSGETVHVELLDAGTYTCEVIAEHHYKIYRDISYTVDATHYRMIIPETECDTCYNETTKEWEECDCNRPDPYYEVTPDDTYSDIKSNFVMDGIDYGDPEYHTYDNPLICVGCPGVYWCVGCESGVCDNTDRYVCDNNVNGLSIEPYAYLIE